MGNLVAYSPVHLHGIPPFLAAAQVVIWKIPEFPDDFPSRFDGLVIDYIVNEWQESDPPMKGEDPQGPQRREINIGNFDYDKFRTYYIKVTELPARVINRPRHNLIEFWSPIELEVSVRRLTRGEAYPQMQNIMLELIRIFFMFNKYDIYGVQAVDFETLTPLSNPQNRTRQSAAKTLWKKTLRINLHYFKVSLLRPDLPH